MFLWLHLLSSVQYPNRYPRPRLYRCVKYVPLILSQQRSARISFVWRC